MLDQTYCTFRFPDSVMLIGLLYVLGVLWERVAQMNCQSDDTQNSCPKDDEVHGVRAGHGDRRLGYL